MFFYCNFVPGISLNLKIVTMRLPEDPVMLYSFINMKLRDFYPSLDALCEDMNVEKEDIVRKLKLVGFEYNPAKNRFCLLYTSPSPRDRQKSRMPSSA